MTLKASFTLYKDTVLEMSWCKVRNDKREKFFTEYRQLFAECAARFGAELLGSLDVYSCKLAPDAVDTIYYTRWPDIQAVGACLDDPAYSRLASLRRECLEYENTGHYFNCSEDTQADFSSAKIYEAWLLWMRQFDDDKERQEAAESSQQYLALIGDAAVRLHGRRGICWLQPASCPESVSRRISRTFETPSHSLSPHGGGIDEWGSRELYESWFESEVHKDNVHLRNRVLEKFNAYAAHLSERTLRPDGGLWPQY